MDTEIILIVALVVVMYFIMQPIRTKYDLERFKPLVIIPLVIIPLVTKGSIHEKSLFVILLSLLLTVWAIWKTVDNFKNK